ncbi:MAG: FAD-dependent oxidoreductase [Bdellovibrionota bacterium]
MKSAVVVGGGVVGIVSAILLKERYDSVYLIEKASELGGLYRSIHTENGNVFDQGYHTPGDTGIKELDKLIYGDLNPKDWNTYHYLKGGNFYKGYLNKTSTGIDTKLLGDELYEQGLKQLLNSPASKNHYDSADEQLRYEFGDIFTDEIFTPLAKKWTGCELSELAQNAHRVFGMGLLCLDREKTNELKKGESPAKFRIGHHHYEDKFSELKFYYPKSGGAEQWLFHLLGKLEASGVTILTEQMVTSINHQEKHISSVTLESGQKVETDILVWTVPLFLCIKAAELKPPFKGSPPERLNVAIFHFAFDKPINIDNHYITCSEPSINIQQITCYPNLANNREDPKPRLSATILSKSAVDFELLKPIVLEELKTIGVIPADANLIDYHTQTLPGAYPIPTHQFVEDSKLQYDFVTENLSNIICTGKAVGTAFVSFSLVADAYKKISQIFN